MANYRGKKKATPEAEVCAVGCSANDLDGAIRKLRGDGWFIRQIFQEGALRDYYRVFAQRAVTTEEQA